MRLRGETCDGRLARSSAPLRRGLLALWMLVVAVSSSAIQAQEFRYRVQLDVPRSLQPLLEDNLEIFRWAGSDEANLDFLRRLVRRTPDEIRTLLASEGYFSPDIRSALKEEAAWWVAQFDIAPGDPVRVKEVTLDFAGAITQADADAQIGRAREAWLLPAGAVFRQVEWESAKRALLRQLIINRFPRARLTGSQARIDPTAGSAVLTVTVDSGPAFRFGRLEISGLQQYPARVIENLNPIEAGAPYDQTKLVELQARLQDTQYFTTVDVRLDVDTPTPEAAPVQVEVVEAKSRRVGFGIGYSTDTCARARVEYGDNNLRERGWRLKTGITADRKVEQALIAGVELPLRRSGARDALTASYTRSEVYEADTVRLGVSRTQRVGSFERTLSAQYLREVQRRDDTDDDTTQALTGNAAWTLRSVDDLLFPRSGDLWNFQIGGAPESALSDQSFLRGYIRGVRYHPAGRDVTFILRGETGKVAAKSRTGIPSDFLFRTGGDQTVRGYAYNSLGPRDERGEIVGGRYLALGAAEVDYWFLPRWGVAVFYDIGNAVDTLDDPKVFSGYGLGVRWRTPVGPVNLDIAYAHDADDLEAAYGEDISRYRLHFSVGFVF